MASCQNIWRQPFTPHPVGNARSGGTCTAMSASRTDGTLLQKKPAATGWLQSFVVLRALKNFLVARSCSGL